MKCWFCYKNHQKKNCILWNIHKNNIKKVESISKKVDVNFGYDGPYCNITKTHCDYIWDYELYDEEESRLNWLKKNFRWPLMYALNKPNILRILMSNGLDLNKTIHIRDSIDSRDSYDINMSRYISNIDSAIIWLNYNVNNEENLDDFFFFDCIDSNTNFPTSHKIIDRITEIYAIIDSLPALCKDTASIIKNYLYGPLLNKLNKYL